MLLLFGRTLLVGSLLVDQIGSDGGLVADHDTSLSNREKNDLLLAALPGASVDVYAGERVVRFENQVILKKQVTHLGKPWPTFKKRIQIPHKWLSVEQQARADGLVPRFIGIYRYGSVTIFVDFDPATYVQRKANNSAAHVATNDLYQAQTMGQFSRVDGNSNRLTSVRADELATYLRHGYRQTETRLDVLREFNAELLDGRRVDALEAVAEMHKVRWPDTFQAEWPGFYVEHRLDAFLKRESHSPIVEFQKIKQKGQFDFDLVFKKSGVIEYYGDLKASDVTKHESPGNDAGDVRRCVDETGRFWYVIYEHETWHSRDNGDVATIRWNTWRREVGHKGAKDFNPLSYSSRFKEAVRFVRVIVLEINPANFHLVLGEFNQGRQQGGAERAVKVMIKKRNIDNFLIYSEDLPR